MPWKLMTRKWPKKEIPVYLTCHGFCLMLHDPWSSITSSIQSPVDQITETESSSYLKSEQPSAKLLMKEGGTEEPAEKRPVQGTLGGT